MENRFKPEQSLPGRLNFLPRPFFSVIITTYNRADLLTRALDSLVSQTEKDWEAIVKLTSPHIFITTKLRIPLQTGLLQDYKS
jgi:hypothetical protein